MQRLKRPGACILAPLALVLMAGCGGGGNSGSSGNTPTTASARAALDVYVTDGFTDAHKQVIATVYKIELSADGNTYQTVFSDAAGRTLDLASLANTAELLSSVTVPVGTYAHARITFGDHITLVSRDGVSVSTAVDPSVGTAAGGQIAVVVTTPTKVQAAQTNAVYVDFKLAEFQLAGNVLRPSITCGGPGGQHGKRHTGHLPGTVANLTSAGFTLQGRNSRSTSVVLTSATTVTSGQTGSPITLANGQNVIVEGKYDPATSTLTATSVTLNDYLTVNHARAAGTVASVDASAKSFVLTVARADGIQPTGGTIVVVTDANTRFGKDRHQSGSLADVAAGAAVEASGVFDTTRQTLTAKFVGLR